MSVNLDMDIGQMVKGMLSGKGAAPVDNKKSQIKSPKKSKTVAENPYRKTMVMGVALGALFVALMGGVYLPYVTSNQEKINTLAGLKEKQVTLQNLESEAAALQKDLAGSTEHYQMILDQFGDQDDIGNLYSAISNMALENNLIVLKVSEVGKVHEKQKMFGTMVKKAEVEVELQGPYMSYIKFRESLVNEPALMSISSENIKVIDDPKNPGRVSTKLKLLTYTIDKDSFNDIMARVEDNKEVLASND